MKKLIKWLFVKEKQEPEYFFEPVWTPYEENERKYEARQKREQKLLAKYGNRQHRHLSACSHGPAVECNLYP